MLNQVLQMSTYVPLAERPEWNDVTPLPLNEAEDAPARINYTTECMS